MEWYAVVLMSKALRKLSPHFNPIKIRGPFLSPLLFKVSIDLQNQTTLALYPWLCFLSSSFPLLANFLFSKLAKSLPAKQRKVSRFER